MFPGTHAQSTPDKPAIVVAETGAVTTYAQLDERSVRLARLLADHGLGPGDHIAFLSDRTDTYS